MGEWLRVEKGVAVAWGEKWAGRLRFKVVVAILRRRSFGDGELRIGCE